MLIIKVPSRNAEALRRAIAPHLDKTRKIRKSDGNVLFPVLASACEWPDLEDVLRNSGAVVVEDPGPVFRDRRLEPIINIRNSLAGTLPAELVEQLPCRWELFGDVLVLPISDRPFHPSVPPGHSSSTTLVHIPREHERIIAAAYAKELRARTVLAPSGPIDGVHRTPEMRFLLGDFAVTTHIENGIKYRFDVSKVMFSPGNVDERIRMGRMPLDGETVVDMFAGIGYFTLPMAKYTGAAHIFACEINPVACDYLRQNIELNGLNNPGECRMTVLAGDNRETAPVNIAHRVVMGYVGTTHEFLPRALSVLKVCRGIIHYHETCPNELMKERPLERIEGAVRDYCKERGIERKVELLNFKKIKSYAPGVSHVVLDVKVEERNEVEK